MATLTDEEKIAALLGGEGETTPQPDEGNKGAAGAEEPASGPESEEGAAEPGTEPDLTEEEKPPKEDEEEGPDEATVTFTKKFSNLKGETWEDYGQNLEEAYQNSFTEALRLDGELKKKDAELAQLRAAVATPPPMPPDPGQVQPVTQPLPPAQPTGIQGTPEYQWLQSQQAASMRESFGKFMEVYPQVKDTANFDAFKKALDPVTGMFVQIEGRQPTYEELFPKVADVLGWQPEKVAGNKAQTIKDTMSQSSPTSGQARIPEKEPPVSDAELTVFMRLNPSISRNDAVKEIAKIKGDPMAFTR